jgi:catechol 2,3-dioxygenase-like lactoylglutathione lyase family enzyme
MPAIRGVTYVGLSVRDVRRSAEWYRELLGMDVANHAHPKEIQMHLGHASITTDPRPVRTLVPREARRARARARPGVPAKPPAASQRPPRNR